MTSKQVRISKETHKRIRLYADLKGVTMTYVLTEAFENYISKRERLLIDKLVGEIHNAKSKIKL